MLAEPSAQACRWRTPKPQTSPTKRDKSAAPLAGGYRRRGQETVPDNFPHRLQPFRAYRGDFAREFSVSHATATGASDGHAHRFRDTFAVELLKAGVPMERASVLLGHSSIKVTERHYSPWLRARQEQLEADVRRTWERSLAETKNTQEAQERREALN